MERKKTLTEITIQASRLMQMCGENQCRRDAIYWTFCKYRDAIYHSKEYWSFRDHVIKCIDGDYGGGITDALEHLTKDDKDIIASRIANNTVRFSRLEIFILTQLFKDNEKED